MMKHISRAALSRKLIVLAIYLLLLVLFSACHVVPGDQPMLFALPGGDRQEAATGPTVQPKISPTAIASNNQPVNGASTTQSSLPRYVVQSGSPAYMQDFAHVEQNCSWTGVAGQVFDIAGSPVSDLLVEVGGKLGGVAVSKIQMTGLTSRYGPGGYEIQLASTLVSSTGTLWIQVLDTRGNQLSNRIYFDTINDCQKSVVVINFNQDGIKQYFPLVFN